MTTISSAGTGIFSRFPPETNFKNPINANMSIIDTPFPQSTSTMKPDHSSTVDESGD
jgi:hypothetical protein